MARICRRLLTGGGAALTLTLFLFAAAPAANAQQPVPTHGGRSYAVGLTGIKALGTVSVGDTFVPGSVNLPPAGGSEHGAVGTMALPAGLGSVVVARSDVQGDAERSSARSEVRSVTLLPGGPAGAVQLSGTAAVLEAHVLMASATIQCGSGPSLDSGVASLSILGQQIDVRSTRNSVIEVRPGGLLAARVQINVQGSQAASHSASAIVVEFPATGPLAALLQGTITLSHAEAAVGGCAARPNPRLGPKPQRNAGSDARMSPNPHRRPGWGPASSPPPHLNHRLIGGGHPRLATGGGDPDLAVGADPSLAPADARSSTDTETSSATSGNRTGSGRTGNPATGIPRRPDGSELWMVLVPTVLAAIAGLAAGAHLARRERP